jgi:DNA-binding NarL/FixJ family response regulator
MSDPIRVLLAEDQAIVRAGFRALLDAEPDLEVAGEAADGRATIALARELRPDLVLMDIRMPELDGLEATRQITADPTLNDTRVLVLTTFELDEYVFGALRAGASGFLLKGGEPGDLLSAIRLVATGESLLAPSVTRRLIEAYISQPEQGTTAGPDGLDGLDDLSPRELEVLALVARGSNNREIADALYLSPLTVKTHVSRILMKLRARDRVQLVVIAYQAGLVSP